MAEMLKKVVLHSVATALASNVLPVYSKLSNVQLVSIVSKHLIHHYIYLINSYHIMRHRQISCSIFDVYFNHRNILTIDVTKHALIYMHMQFT